MNERTAVTADDPASETRSSAALFLSMIAIVGFAMCILSLDRAELAVGLGLVSLVSFVASLVLFSADAQESTEA